jgi:hypothetical protein
MTLAPEVLASCAVLAGCAPGDEATGEAGQLATSCPASQQNANNYTYGEVRQYVNYLDRTAPYYHPNSGLGDMKASIGAVCARNTSFANCNCVAAPGTGATPGDVAAWNNIVNASGTDRSNSAGYLCVRPDSCVIVHDCYAPDTGTHYSRALSPVATLTLGAGVVDFYTDPTGGKCYVTDWARACGAVITPGTSSNNWIYSCVATDHFTAGSNVPILASFSQLTVDHRFRARITRSGSTPYYTPVTDYNVVGSGWLHAFYWYTINAVQRGTWTVEVQIGTRDGVWHLGRTAIFTVP